MALPLFWLALISQLAIVLGYFWFYRKEQLSKYSALNHSFLLLTTITRSPSIIKQLIPTFT